MAHINVLRQSAVKTYCNW